MKTLHDIFESGGQASAPYYTAVKVVVCGVGQVVQYRNASGDQRESMTIGFADHSMAVKGTLYDITKKETMKVGTTVMLLNTIIKRDMKTIVITNKSKVLKTSPLADIPQQRIQEGHALACPPPADRVQIKTVHTSPVKTLVTIRGQIISEEMERTVKVGGVDTNVRSLRIKDDTSVCKVTLWRDFTKRKTSVGTHIELKDVAVQLYNDEKSLATTWRTTLEEVETPEMAKVVNFIGFEWVNSDFLSMTAEDEDFMEFKVSKAILRNALGCEEKDVEDLLLKKLPLLASIKFKDQEIQEIRLSSGPKIPKKS